MKKLLSISLSVLMLVSMISSIPFAVALNHSAAPKTVEGTKPCVDFAADAPITTVRIDNEKINRENAAISFPDNSKRFSIDEEGYVYAENCNVKQGGYVGLGGFTLTFADAAVFPDGSRQPLEVFFSEVHTIGRMDVEAYSDDLCFAMITDNPSHPLDFTPLSLKQKMQIGVRSRVYFRVPKAGAKDTFLFAAHGINTVRSAESAFGRIVDAAGHYYYSESMEPMSGMAEGTDFYYPSDTKLNVAQGTTAGSLGVRFVGSGSPAGDLSAYETGFAAVGNAKTGFSSRVWSSCGVNTMPIQINLLTSGLGYELTTAAGENGSISLWTDGIANSANAAKLDGGTGETPLTYLVPNGKAVTLVITPDTGYGLQTLFLNGTTVQPTRFDDKLGSYEYDIPAELNGENCEVSASFKLLEKPTIEMNVIDQNSTYGEPVTITATLPADANGSVTFTLTGSSNNYSFTDDSITDGVAQITQKLNADTYAVTASYSGDGKYAAATASTTLTVNPTPLDYTIAFSPENPKAGETVQITVVIAEGTTLMVNGAVLEIDGKTIGQVDHSDSNVVFTVNNLTTGDHTVKIIPSGDANHIGVAKSATLTVACVHVWNTPTWDWTDADNPAYSTTCTLCADGQASGSVSSSKGTRVAATAEADAYTPYSATVTLDGQTFHDTFNLTEPGTMLAARKAAFDAYKDELKQAAEDKRKDGDSDESKKLIDDAIAAIDAMEYDESKSLDENKAAVDTAADLTELTEQLEEHRAVYYAVFKADGAEVARVPFTIDTKAITAPAVPVKGGHTGAWPNYELKAGSVEINAVYIKNGALVITDNAKEQGEGRVLTFMETVTFTTDTSALPEGATLCWYVNGEAVTAEKSVTVEAPKNDYTVQVKAFAKDGTLYAESDVLTVKVDHSFWAKLVYFFRLAFGPVTDALKKVVPSFFSFLAALIKAFAAALVNAVKTVI